MFTSYSRENKKEGFTLIEMVVSLAIFSVVAVIALGALMRIISANQKAQAIQAAVTNVNFALESMSREIRVGTGLISSDSANISFVPSGSADNCHAYRFSDENGIKHLQKAEGTVSGVCSVSSFANGDFAELTSPNITLTNGYFEITADAYKLVTISLTGFAGDKEKNRTYFDVKTAVSARVQ